MRISILLASLALTTGCSTTLIRVAAPEPGEGRPRIEETIDLGGLPLPAAGELKQKHADDRYTPGEMVALVGKNLHAATAVSVGGMPAAIEGYLKGGSLLVRVPRGLSAGNQSLTVETPGGVASAKVAASYYAYGADTHSDTLHFRRFGPESSSFEEDAEFDIELEKARFQELSPDGSLLYAIQKPVLDTPMVSSQVNTLIKVARKISGGDVSCTMLVVHMGGKDEPEVASRLPLTLSSKPTGMAAGKDRLVVLQKRQLMVLDTSNPVAPQQMGTLELASKDQERELIDAEFLGDGSRWLAVLEAYENTVHLVDLADPAHPTLAGGALLSKAIGEPFSIDMALADDGQSVWVLQGPNMRLAGKRLLDGVKGVWRDVRKLEFKQALGTAGDAIVGATMPPQKGLCRVVRARLTDSGLQLVQSIPLPEDLFPYFVQPDGHGSLYVSGINRTIFDLSKLEFSLDGLMALIEMLKNATQLGRIHKLDTATGRDQLFLQAVGIYYDLDILPNGELMTSTIRLGPGYLPPRVTLDWGLEAGGKFSKLREIANSTTSLTDAIKKLMPPYDYERIGVQR